MKPRLDRWGPVRTGTGHTVSMAHKINVAAEIAESRAFTERLFSNYHRGGHRRTLGSLRRIDWPLHPKRHDA